MMRKCYVISSTHWDREWYQTFEQFRYRLVRMMDHLLSVLEQNPDYKQFYFDGQTVVLEDYLRIRPQNAARLSELIRAGRIVIGPWYTMPDEFLVSGESLIKNLQTGHKVCADYGVKPFRNGYVCDIFGHNSQLPQIMRGFGIDSATLFRGIGDFAKTNFTWQGADGSELTVFKLHKDYSYSNFFFIMRWYFEDKGFNDAELVANMKRYLDEEKESFACDSLLFLDGVDHCDAEEQIPRIIRLLNDNIQDCEFIHGGFEELLSEVRAQSASFETITGTLTSLAQSGTNNLVVRNVTSSLVPLKQANDLCERLLIDFDAPFDAFTNMLRADFSPLAVYRSAYPRDGYFQQAWHHLLKNQAHDSICGCSITEVHEDNEFRFKRASEIAELMRGDIADELLAYTDTTARGKTGITAIFNPCQTDYDSIAEVTIEIVATHDTPNLRIYDERGNNLSYAIIGRERFIKEDTPFKKLVQMREIDRLTLAIKLSIPAYSYRLISFDNLLNRRKDDKSDWKFQEYYPPRRYLGSMRVRNNVIDNGALEITVLGDGTLNVVNKATGRRYEGLGYFEDSADDGDGWSYVPPPFDGLVDGRVARTEVIYENDTPFVLDVRIVKHLDIPEELSEGRRSTRTVPLVVTTLLRIRKDATRLDFTTSFDNTADAHRLQVCFPLGIGVARFFTSTPFDVVNWPKDFPDSSCAKEIETYVRPTQGLALVQSDGNQAALYTKGLYEVSLLGKDNVLKLTLLRAFNREIGRYRADIGRLRRSVTCQYALDFLSDDLPLSDTLKRCVAYKTGLYCRATEQHKGNLSSTPCVGVEGNAVLGILESLYDGSGRYCLRIYDVDGGSYGKIRFFRKPSEIYEADLNNEIIAKVNLDCETLNYCLGTKQIKTYLFKI